MKFGFFMFLDEKSTLPKLILCCLIVTPHETDRETASFKPKRKTEQFSLSAALRNDLSLQLIFLVVIVAVLCEKIKQE